MINELTEEQEKKIVEYHHRYFAQATSTKRADRKRAGTAARALAEIAGVKTDEVVWVDNLDIGKEKYISLSGTTITVTIKDILIDEIWGTLREIINNEIWGTLKSTLLDNLRATLRESLRNSFNDELWRSLKATLCDTNCDTIWATLRATFCDTLWDTGFTALATFVVEELEVKISSDAREKLDLVNEILASCYAIWITTDTIILCERPKTTNIQDGKLIGMEW